MRLLTKLCVYILKFFLFFCMDRSWLLILLLTLLHCMLCWRLICLYCSPFNCRLIRKSRFVLAQLHKCIIRENILGTEKSGNYTQLQFWRLRLWHEVMVDNKHELCLWRTKLLVLAGNTQLTGNCVENSCKLHTIGMHLLSETDMCYRFSGGKQTKKQNKKPIL